MKPRLSRYSGLLAEPLKFNPLPVLRLDKPHPMFLALGLPAEEWQTFLKALWKQDFEKFYARRRALFSHFNINLEHPGAEMDLALSLAYRHERATLINGERVSITALCNLFETTDPVQLSWRLAAKHVPGFRSADPKRFERRVSSGEWVEIFIAYLVVVDHLERKGGKASDREVVNIILDKKKLKEIIPEKAARTVQTVLEHTGNKDRNSPRDLKSRHSFLRVALREARNAWIDLRSFKVSDFQLQWVTQIWPLLNSLTPAEDGQNGPPSGPIK